MTAPGETAGRTDVVVAGIGSAHRHDDAVGAVVSEYVARLGGARDVGPIADPLELLGRWDGAALAVVVDAVRSGAEPGSVRIVELTDPAASGPTASGRATSGRATSGADPSADRPVPAAVRRRPPGARATSSHGIDLMGVLRLARAVDRAPARVVLVGVEGADFSPGTGLTREVAAAVPGAIGAVVRLVRGVRTCA